MNLKYTVNNTRLIIGTLASLIEISYFEAPYKPLTPEGSKKAKVNVEQKYNTYTTDPQDDDIYYLFDWGDGTQSQWLGPYSSGDTCTGTHTWEEEGNYEIKVKAKDPEGHESEWSDSLTVAMPKNRIFEKNIIVTIFTKILNIFQYSLS